MTQYFQSVLGFSTLKAGALLVPQAVVMMIFAPLSTGFVARFGNKFVVGTGLLIVSLTLLLMAQLQVHEPLWHVMAVTALLGLGMSQVFAPATDSIMGSLPKEKAGVGSAMNDTTRQAGGAVGVAVLGSILASRFHNSVASGVALHNLPSTAIHSDLSSSLAYARSAAGRPFATQIIQIARQSYVDAFHVALYLGAGFMVVAAIAVVRWLPHRASETQPAPTGLVLDVA